MGQTQARPPHLSIRPVSLPSSLSLRKHWVQPQEHSLEEGANGSGDPPSLQAMQKQFLAFSESEGKNPAQVEGELELPAFLLLRTSGDLPQHDQEGGGRVSRGPYWELDCPLGDEGGRNGGGRGGGGASRATKHGFRCAEPHSNRAPSFPKTRARGISAVLGGRGSRRGGARGGGGRAAGPRGAGERRGSD